MVSTDAIQRKYILHNMHSILNDYSLKKMIYHYCILGSEPYPIEKTINVNRVENWQTM